MPLRRLLPLLITALALTLAACGNDDADQEGASPAATSAAEATPETTETGCRQVEAPAPKDVDPGKPTEQLDPSRTYVATLQTSCGEFEITLAVDESPKTASSFAHLAREDVFENTTFHRIVPGFVIQGGDPQGNGMGGPGYSVREAPPRDLQYTRGVVAMAKTGAEPAGTSGSQFFVVTGEDVGLPPDYALLGRVTGGEEVVDAIATAATDPATEQPIDPVVIESVEITER